MLFIGIDLAWSTKNGSGIVILKGDKKAAEFVSGKILYSDQEIMDYIKSEVGNQNAIISIDAPLLVPNETGRRIAEDIIQALFGKYDAGAYPANRKNMSKWTGTIRGEELSKLLEKEGFRHDPTLTKYEKSRKFFEVYPHPSMIVVFGLDRILQYKSKPNRDYAFRWNVFKQYQKYLKGLEKSKIPLKLPKDILQKDVMLLKGKKLKEYEDLLDGIFCAYLSYYYWMNPTKCAILGSIKDGYILSPIHESMKTEMKTIQKRIKQF